MKELWQRDDLSCVSCGRFVGFLGGWTVPGDAGEYCSERCVEIGGPERRADGEAPLAFRKVPA